MKRNALRIFSSWPHTPLLTRMRAWTSWQCLMWKRGDTLLMTWLERESDSGASWQDERNLRNFSTTYPCDLLCCFRNFFLSSFYACACVCEAICFHLPVPPIPPLPPTTAAETSLAFKKRKKRTHRQFPAHSFHISLVFCDNSVLHIRVKTHSEGKAELPFLLPRAQSWSIADNQLFTACASIQVFLSTLLKPCIIYGRP